MQIHSGLFQFRGFLLLISFGIFDYFFSLRIQLVVSCYCISVCSKKELVISVTEGLGCCRSSSLRWSLGCWLSMPWINAVDLEG